MLLPSVIATAGLTDLFWARFALSGYAGHCVLVWAIGGWWVARLGSMQAGGLIMGLLGLASGLILSRLAIGTDFMSLAVLGCSACGYGSTVGLLVGRLLETPGGESA
jgi:hypothetical protein